MEGLEPDSIGEAIRESSDIGLIVDKNDGNIADGQTPGSPEGLEISAEQYDSLPEVMRPIACDHRLIPDKLSEHYSRLSSGALRLNLLEPLLSPKK